MTHPHGLTRQDVAHLKAGDEVTVRMMIDDEVRTLTSTAYDYADTLWIAGHDLKHHDGAPGAFLVEVISPKPPTPPMAEPTWLGAVVMTDEGYGASNPLVLNHVTQGRPWRDSNGCHFYWHELRNPRPLTADERRQYGIPETIPEGWVAVDAHSIQSNVLQAWVAQGEYSGYENSALASVALAELARREAQG